jgi:hypothetical protein
VGGVVGWGVGGVLPSNPVLIDYYVRSTTLDVCYRKDPQVTEALRGYYS